MKNQSTSPKRTLSGIVAFVALLFVATLAPQAAYGDPAPAIIKLADLANDTLYPTEQHAYNLKGFFQDPLTDTVALTFSTKAGVTPTTVNIDLFPEDAPKTVSNFLRYVETGTYNGSFFHRAETNFVVQTGGYSYTTNADGSRNFFYVSSFGPVVNEYSLSNTEGTLAMAKVEGNPNSATNQWFVNLGDNSANLDNQNGGFTVFGKVASDTDLTFFKYIAGLPRSNDISPLSGVPHDANALITLISATTNSTLTFSVTGNTNPGLVSAEIDADGILKITGIRPAVTATATLTVTAFGSESRTLSQTFDVTVTDKRYLAAQNVFPTLVVPGQAALGNITDFASYDAYPAGTPFTIKDGEISFDGKKWLKKGVIPAGAITVWVRVKTKKAYDTNYTATLTLGGEVIKFVARTGTPDLYISQAKEFRHSKKTFALTDNAVGEGDKFDVSFFVVNQGTAPSPATTLSLWFDPDYTSYETIAEIMAGNKVTKSVSIPKIAAGSYRQITVKGVTVKSRYPEYSDPTNKTYDALLVYAIDRTGKLPEVGDGKTNNFDYDWLSVGRPNLGFSAASLPGHTLDGGKYALGVGEKHNIEFAIGNNGKFVAKATKASLWLVDNASGLKTSVKPLKTLSIPKVEAGVQTAKPLVFKNVVIKQAGDFSYKIEIDREGKLVGENTSDNVATLQAIVTAAP